MQLGTQPCYAQKQAQQLIIFCFIKLKIVFQEQSLDLPLILHLALLSSCHLRTACENFARLLYNWLQVAGRNMYLVWSWGKWDVTENKTLKSWGNTVCGQCMVKEIWSL